MESIKRKVRIAAAILFSLAVIAAIGVGVTLAVISNRRCFEADERLFESAAGFGSTTFYADSMVDGGQYTPIAIETGGGMRKIFYSLEEISPYFKDGVIAVEDREFYSHNGFNLRRTAYAAISYLLGGSRVFGASTITQQVVKNISGDNQPTVRRKIEEIIRALHIERAYSKEEILEVYLNIIPMSENIYGVGAASRAYFGKDPEELLPHEAATLIGITNAPTAYNPYINPDACKRKRDIVLSVMRDEGVISEEQYDKATGMPLSVISRENREDRVDSWFVETVIDDATLDLSEKYGISESAARMMMLGGGYKVYTTMSIQVQQTIEEYFENANNFPNEINSGLNYAMAVTDSKSGYLLGIVGRVGKKNANRILNHATVPHIPGSTLKPIALYAPLIDEGKINWATVFDDVPVSFTENNGEYREYPHNSPNAYDGLVSIQRALAESKNTVAVRLCNLRTPVEVFKSLRDDFSINTLVEREGGVTDIAVAPMALGQLSRGIPLRNMTEAYSVFCREGEWAESCSYLSIFDYNDRLIIEKEQKKNNVFKPSTARIMNQLLMTVTDEGTASRISLKKLVDTAGKTGTSSGNKDKWFIGYTPYYCAGIWCGFDNGEGSVAGLSVSQLDVWDAVMTLLHEKIVDDDNTERFSVEGLYRLPYCMDSGERYTDVCRFDPRGDRQAYGYFSIDNQPSLDCNRHVLCKYDSVGKGIANESCPDSHVVGVSLIKILDRAFPKEIYVTDAEFVYRDIDGYTQRPTDDSLPYFQYTLPDGVYVGISRRKKQFNSGCPMH